MTKILILIIALFAITGRAAAADPCTLRGKASWYHEPQRLASGGRFDPNGMTAAHRTLPFGTLVRVTNVKTRRSAVVRINDRGPFRKSRIIDVSKAAARELQMITAGVATVTLEIISQPG